MSKSFEEVVLELLSKIQHKLVEHDNRFDGIDARLNGIDVRLDGIDTRLDGIDVRLDGVDARLDSIDAKLQGHDQLFDQIIEGMAPELKKTTLHDLKLKDHERRIRHLEAHS